MTDGRPTLGPKGPIDLIKALIGETEKLPADGCVPDVGDPTITAAELRRLIAWLEDFLVNFRKEPVLKATRAKTAVQIKADKAEARSTRTRL